MPTTAKMRMVLRSTFRYHLATAMALVFAGQVFAQQPGIQNFRAMKYGFFVTYSWDNPDQLRHPGLPGAVAGAIRSSRLSRNHAI